MNKLLVVLNLLRFAEHLILAFRSGVKLDEEAIRKLTIRDLVQFETFDDIVRQLEEKQK
jgi:hypothetical protein